MVVREGFNHHLSRFVMDLDIQGFQKSSLLRVQLVFMIHMRSCHFSLIQDCYAGILPRYN